jgi:hypothetical protein
VYKVDSNSAVYYGFEQWATTTGLTHGVFTRLGGVSDAPFDSLNVGGTVGDDPAAVQQNLARIYAAMDADANDVCTVWQVHSADVVVANDAAVGRRWLARADGMVTNQRGVPLTMRFADCVPILFYDPKHEAIGIAHAGWRGTVGQVTVNTLQTMIDAFRSDPAEVQAAIGPSIGPEQYQVGAEVVEAVQLAFGTTDGLIQHRDDGSTTFDLWAANRLVLERAGVQQIEVAGICTAKNTHEFFSHRAEKGKTGRFAAVIMLRER